jgi:3-deoxy-manno-octulosonate cytidylyltransferase (CMP-KDO synthetase)
VEQRGINTQQNVIAVIPARYSSKRLPGKLLCDIAGKPLILHTFDQTSKAARVTRVIVATDDSRIYEVVAGYGAEVVMTANTHESGSDRIAEVAAGLPPGSLIVNVQGDEPMISPDTIDLAIDAMICNDPPNIVTTSEPINDVAELMNSNVVKVVTDDAGFAIYFSRSPIPYPREASMRYGSLDAALQNEPKLLRLFRKHTGLYVYRREFVIKFSNIKPSKLERIEMLEQLRALENGARIRVVEVSESSIGVDTADDLKKVRLLLNKNG